MTCYIAPATTPEEQSHIPTANRIRRIPASAADSFFDEFYRHGRPVIITGLVRRWACFRKWTIDYLRRTIGEREHTFRYEGGKTMSSSVAGYLDALETGCYRGLLTPSSTEIYAYIRHFGPIGGRFLADYAIHSLFPEPQRFNFSSFLFCGVTGTKTNCHFDWTHNFVGVVRGTKHVTLLPPKSERYMTVCDDLKQRMSVGHCDYFDDPRSLQLRPGHRGTAMHQHPVFASCPELYYSPLDAGDVVFFPAYWYHYFHNLEGTISVSTQSCPL